MTRAGATIPGPPIATVTMNPSIDQHILIDRLVKDDAIRARDIRRDPGGKGINVSRVLTELGAETLAFGLTGGGAGYIVKSLLHERGIAFVSVDVLEETRINFIFTDRSDRTQTHQLTRSVGDARRGRSASRARARPNAHAPLVGPWRQLATRNISRFLRPSDPRSRPGERALLSRRRR
jgi:hypothetical protein